MKTTRAHTENTDWIFRTLKKYSTRDTIPLRGDWFRLTTVAPLL
jgi:hypothetical protein